MFAVPRSRCVIFDTNGNATVGSADIRHGESETRFVAVTKQYVSPEVSQRNGGQVPGRVGGGVGGDGRNAWNTECQTLIVSDDTDMFVILMSNPYMHGRGVLHVLIDTLHNLDLAIAALQSMRTCGRSVAAMYCLAGCDFTPSIYGLQHDTFWGALKMFRTYGKSLAPPMLARREEADFLFCILYLARYGKSKFCTEGDRRRFITQEVGRGTLSTREIVSLRRSFFVSEEAVESATWWVDVRNFVAHNADTTNRLLPHNVHIMLHCGRADFVVMKYWGRADDIDLSDATVGAATEREGYMKDGTVVLEEKKDMQTILNCIKSVIKCYN
ncbi:hypothetical protein BWQ96_10700 [Gracilariopsis chorda]|uniref:Uncharacterized protein n=1 Tax=Gracilariopsis chorda TaxID=448386 RepID=A0A2V3IBX7_9FLOR|nr:hypothetical protein BWQ96_10700 [Gracilariopsis chorda]|eukprot:PXF39599.1 hypothetical protein BWQ96_10700 [Gracilariopsis chorda]